MTAEEKRVAIASPPRRATRPAISAIVARSHRDTAAEHPLRRGTTPGLQPMPRVELRTKKNTLRHRFFLTLILPKTIPSLAVKNSLQRTRLITGRTGKMATKKAAKKVAKKAAKKK
jgi:hypothetical protein